jgi:hypothetical protein
MPRGRRGPEARARPLTDGRPRPAPRHARRRYISAAQQVAGLAWNRRRDLETVKQRAEALVLGASSDTLSRRAVPSPLGMDVASHGLPGAGEGRWSRRRLHRPSRPGHYHAWVVARPVPPGAATGSGKTAVAGQIALRVAEQHGPVVFVSMELTDIDLAVRLVSVITNIRKEKLVTGALNPEQAEEVLDTINRLSRSRLHIVFGSGSRARMCARTPFRCRRPRGSDLL